MLSDSTFTARPSLRGVPLRNRYDHHGATGRHVSALDRDEDDVELPDPESFFDPDAVSDPHSEE